MVWDQGGLRCKARPDIIGRSIADLKISRGAGPDEYPREMLRFLYETVEQLQIDLDQWIDYYNNERTHQGKLCEGRTPMQTLMDPQWEGLVRQNLRMLLEQAQVALLSGNQTLYAESLQRANHWVAEFFESDESAARAMASEIDQLADLRIAVEMPDISRSLSALDDAIERRLEQGGAE